MQRIALAAAILAASLALSLAPTAAQGPGMMGGSCPMMSMMGPGMGQGTGHGMGQGGMGHMGSEISAIVEARLAYLHTTLGIGEAQQSAWDAYATAVRDQVAAMQQNHAALWQAMHAGTAPDRMTARIAAMSAMLSGMQALQPATVALYESLDQAQRVIADQLIGSECGAF